MSLKRALYHVGEFLTILVVIVGMLIINTMKDETSESLFMFRIGVVIIFAAIYFVNFKVCRDLEMEPNETTSSSEPETFTSSLESETFEKPLPLERSAYSIGEVSMTVSLFMFYGIEYYQFPLFWRFIAAIPVCVSISKAVYLKKQDFGSKENLELTKSESSTDDSAPIVQVSTAVASRLSSLRRQSEPRIPSPAQDLLKTRKKVYTKKVQN